MVTGTHWERAVDQIATAESLTAAINLHEVCRKENAIMIGERVRKATQILFSVAEGTHRCRRRGAGIGFQFRQRRKFVFQLV